ncbi:MAG: MFS transporter [Alphaproteobacteria bacterium]
MAGVTGAAISAKAQPAIGRDAGLVAQFSWAALDFARVPYNTLVNIFVFSAYFSTVVIGDPKQGQVVWSYITSASALLVALGAPLLGAIADAGGRRKPWIAASIVVGIPCMSLLWFAAPGMHTGMWLIVLGLIGGQVSFEYGAVFMNAMLPNIAPPNRIGFVSGLSLAFGNVATIILFTFFLFAWSWNPHPLFGLSAAAHEPERAVGPLVGLWLMVFCLPMFFLTPDSPGTSRNIGQAVSHGLKNLLGTFVRVREYANVARFLIARMSFNEGFIILMLFTGVFAAGILHWTPTMLIVEGLINSVVAASAGLFSGWLDTKLGSKRATMAFVVGTLVLNVILCSISPHEVFFIALTPAQVASDGGLFGTLPDKVFLVTQCLVAFFVTGALGTARAMMAKISPPHMLNEFFGLFAFSGTATSFIGPLAIGLVTQIFNSQRAGVAVGVVFFIVGFSLMFLVKEEQSAASESH